MRANQHAFSALNAKLLVPHWNLLRNVALLPLSRRRRKSPIHGQRAHWQVVTPSRDDRTENVANKAGGTDAVQPEAHRIHW